MLNKQNQGIKKQGILITIVAILVVVLIILFTYPQVKEKRIQRNDKKRIDSLISWNNVSFITKQDKAFALLESTKSIAIETTNPEIIGNVYNKEGSFLKQLNYYPKAIIAYKQAAKLYNKSQSIEKLADAYFNIADIYKIIGDYSQSLDYCSRCLDLYQKLKNKNGIKRCYRILGSDYKYLKDFDKSILYYNWSLIISKEISNSEDIAVALNNIGTAYEAMGNDSAAFRFYQQCYNVYNKSNNYNGLATYFNNTGSILMREKKYELALINFRLALKYRKKTGDVRRESTVLGNIGEYFFKKDLYDSSIYYYQKSLNIGLKYGIKERISSCHRALSENYIKNKMPYEAYQELAKYINVQDTVFNAQKSIEIARIEANFDIFKEQLQDKSDEQKHNLLTVIFVLSVIVFSFGFIVLYKRYRNSLLKQQEYNQVLVNEKSKIEEVLSEKNKELITYSLQIAQKQEIDQALVERIRVEISNSSGETKKKLQELLTNIIHETQRVDVWEDFELRFNQVNQNFYHNLLEKHPQLSQNEKRLCAFLKLNLSTKEITIITGQSPHSINVARTRLRKKLGLSNCNQNLFDFLQVY